MSYHGEKEMSTPVGKTTVLPRPGYSKSISPIFTTVGPSSSRNLRRRKGEKRQKSPLSKRRKTQKISYDRDIIRDAPAPIADIRSIIGEPLHPRPQLFGSPKDANERIDSDVEYVQVPEFGTTWDNHEQAEKTTEGREDEESEEEYHVLKPLGIYQGPGARLCNRKPDIPYFSYVPITAKSGVPEYKFPRDPEADRLWDEAFKEDAEKFAAQQLAAPQKKTIRYREIMLRIRKEAAEKEAEPKRTKTRKQPRRQKTKEQERSSSPEMITIKWRGNLTEFIVLDSDDECDSYFTYS